MKFCWEMIYAHPSEEIAVTTARAKVIGGWIVHHTVCDENGNSLSMVFVPDPKHDWKCDTNLPKNPMRSFNINEMPIE